jgi:PhnB protein
MSSKKMEAVDSRNLRRMNHHRNLKKHKALKGRYSKAAVSVMLIVPNAQRAIDWYKEALGASELWNLGGVAGLEIRGAPFYIHESNPGNSLEKSPLDAGVTSTRIELFVDNPEDVMMSALTAGATIGSPIEDHSRPWGIHRQGGFRILLVTIGRLETNLP